MGRGRNHGVMNMYEPIGLGEAGLPAPPGTNFPASFPGLDLLSQVGSMLTLTPVGLFTPWGGRTGGVSWDDVKQPPDTNIALSSLTDALVRMVPTVTFGAPLPFIAVLTTKLPTPNEVEAMWSGTDYQAYETDAIYDQADASPTPRILFLHWAERRQAGASGAGNKSLDQAAGSVGGRLVFAMQVDYRSTSRRQPPAIPFQQALAMQLSGGGGQQKVPPVDSGPPPAKTDVPPLIEKPVKISWVYPALIATGTAIIAFFVVRAMRGR